ncbi:MAG: amidase family protein [candidate division NC10 bacterium]|nr:amidase family protein [candidate division NC10 bacterium]
MSEREKEMDRRTFIKASLAAAGGLALTHWMGEWAEAGSPLPQDLADSSLYELSQRIQRGEITSRHLVETYLDRIRRLDGPNGLNAYITVAEEEALRRAEELDRLAQQKKFQGPLHGLPIAVKDNLDTEDMPTTGGSQILMGWRPPQDAHVVQRLRKAGAIILGKTNMHEFAFGITTNNPHYGPTRNPYDPTCIPGGSSGGSAAAVAAALCAGAIGTDTGGSVRIPAALCGVVGLKPTLGRVGRGGMMYLSFMRDVIGPLTRTVMDSALILEVIAGSDPRDPESQPHRLPPLLSPLLKEAPSLRGRKFGVPRKYFFEVIHPDTQEVMERALRKIQSLGAKIKEVEVKHMDLATPTGFNIVLTECIYLMEDYLRAFDPEATIDKYLDQMGPDVKGVLGSQKGTPDSKPVPGYVYAQSVREDRRKMIAGFQEALRGLDALLLPTTPLPAAKIGDDVETELQGQRVNTFLTFIRNCDPISVVGYPAITVPAGYSKDGLPIGLQMVARPWEEGHLLRMAYAFEQATKVRKAPRL